MTHFPLDLVELERVEPEYAALIRKYGRCVYRQTQFESIRGHLPAELAAFRAAVQEAARAGD